MCSSEEAVIWIGATSNLCTPLFIVVGPKHPWREAGPPNGKADSDRKVVNQELSLSGQDLHTPSREREFLIDNLLVRIHFVIVMIRWTGLAP